MKPEDHIHFLSELIYAVEQLRELVNDYCQMLCPEEDELKQEIKCNDRPVPF
jgi:hypothetical protein